MTRFLFLSILLMTVTGWSQQIDTTTIRRVQGLEEQIDSLRQVIRDLDTELRRVKESMVEGPLDMDEILTLLSDDEDGEVVPEDQRSRRKQVDELLKAITQRPGQLRFNGGATASLQGKTGGGNHNTSGVGSFDIFATSSFGPHTLLFIDLEAIGGNGLDEIFPTFSGLNDDAGSTQDEDGFDRISVLEAWAEFAILGGMFTMTAGKIDLTNYFDNNASANDETTQFLSGAFVNSAAFVVPDNSPGIRIRTTVLNRFYFQFGVASVDNSGTNLLEELYRIGSMGFKVFPDTEWEGNMRLYGYQHPMVEGAVGYGLSFDQVIFGSYNIFGRYGKNETGLADGFGISSAWSAGTNFIKQLAGYEAVLGIAYGEIDPRSRDLRSERLLEIYLRRQLNSWVHASPHLQPVWNTAGTSEQLAILGFRTHFNF